MPRKTPFNLEIVRSNLAEAIEELQELERKAAGRELLEEELQVGLKHAYHHLNFAWNVRRVSTAEYSHLTQAQFESWGTYPAEIEDL